MSDDAPVSGILSTLHALDLERTQTSLAGGTPPRGRAEDGAEGACRRYRGVRHLGAGGMGRVDAVHDVDLLRDVALKRLLPGLQRDERLVQQFLWEARITAYLDHPHIVPLYDMGHDRGELYFTMKQVRGQTLKDVIAGCAGGDERLSLERRLRLFIQVCHGIAYAHSMGVLHRDLKPANVIVGERGEVQVMDWGLARTLPGPHEVELRALQPEEHRGDDGSSGTPLYMSPEQVTGRELTAASDIYALGVVLYELVTLRRPFDGETVYELLARVAVGDGTPIEDAGAVPSSIAAIVRSAMALDPDDRYASVDAMREDIERHLEGRTPTAEDASLARRFGRNYRSFHPALRQLRVAEMDGLAWGSLLLGIALGAGIGPWLGGWAWVILAAGAVITCGASYTWWRRYLRTRED